MEVFWGPLGRQGMGYVASDLNYTCLDYIWIIFLGKAVANLCDELEKGFNTSANSLHGGWRHWQCWLYDFGWFSGVCNLVISSCWVQRHEDNKVETDINMLFSTPTLLCTTAQHISSSSTPYLAKALFSDCSQLQRDEK